MSGLSASVSHAVCPQYSAFLTALAHALRAFDVTDSFKHAYDVQDFSSALLDSALRASVDFFFCRNMFDMRPDTSLQTLSSLVEYIRREVLALDLQSDDDIVQGRIVFGKVPAPAKC